MITYESVNVILALLYISFITTSLVNIWLIWNSQKNTLKRQRSRKIRLTQPVPEGNNTSLTSKSTIMKGERSMKLKLMCYLGSADIARCQAWIITATSDKEWWVMPIDDV